MIELFGNFENVLAGIMTEIIFSESLDRRLYKPNLNQPEMQEHWSVWSHTIWIFSHI